MLSKNKLLFNSLIQTSAEGIEVASYNEIRSALTARYKEIYGDDIDISTSTADGQYIEMLCLIINNMLQNIKTLYGNLDVNTAQGKFLEMLSSITNVTRRPASHSTASISVKMIDMNYTLPANEELSFMDKNGNEWVYKSSSATTLLTSKYTTLIVEAREPGPLRADPSWIDTCTDGSLMMTIQQSEPAQVGTYEESDADLRARRLQSNGSAGMTVLQNLIAALYEVDGIKEVKIYNNDSNANFTTQGDNTTVYAHSVYVLIRRDSAKTIPDSVIGSILYEKMTPGITFSQSSGSRGTAKSYQYVETIDGNPLSASNINAQMVYWKDVSTVGPADMTIRLEHLPTYDNSRFSPSQYNQSITDRVINEITNYVNNLPISSVITKNMIEMVATLADPLYKNMPTFKVTTVDFKIQETAETELEYYDSFPKVTYYSAVDGSYTDGGGVVHYYTDIQFTL